MDFTAILVPKMPILIQVMMAWLLFVSTTTAFSVQIPQHSRVTTTVQAPLQRSSSSTSTALEMASGGALSCRPIGIGSAVPATRLTNAELESVVETTDEWIQTRTGIAARRVLVTQSSANDATATAENADAPLQSSERLSDLSIAAARNALQMANIDATDISVLICCTSSPDDLFGDAPTIAAALGCTTDTVAFDLTAACSGFLFGMVTAGHFLTVPTTSSSAPRRALVIGADALSRWVDWDDRNACILFGDGAGAMVLEACETTPTSNVKDSFGILGFATHSNGNGHGDLKLEYVLLVLSRQQRWACLVRLKM